MASRNLLDDVLTVKRMDCGLREELGAGPRDTVAIDRLDSEAVRRGRDILCEGSAGGSGTFTTTVLR